jgi:hypothetical protein
VRATDTFDGRDGGGGGGGGPSVAARQSPGYPPLCDVCDTEPSADSNTHDDAVGLSQSDRTAGVPGVALVPPGASRQKPLAGFISLLVAVITHTRFVSFVGSSWSEQCVAQIVSPFFTPHASTFTQQFAADPTFGVGPAQVWMFTNKKECEPGT